MKQIFTIVFAASLLSGCSSHAYYDEAQIFLGDVQHILISNGMCDNKQDCSNKQLVKFEAGGWSFGPWSGGGVNISVYQVTGEAIVQALHSSFSSRRTEMPKVSVYLHAYSTKHGEPKTILAEYAYQ